MKKFAFFDIDNTLYNGYSTTDFNLYLVNKEICPPKFKTTNIEINQACINGDLKYEVAAKMVIQLTADIVKGHAVDEIAVLADTFMNEKDRFFPFVPNLFNFLFENNFEIHLVSAAAGPIADGMARFLKTTNYFCSDFEVVENKYTGKVVKFLNNDEKSQAAESVLSKFPGNHLTIAFGDTTGDAEMLSLVNHAFVINPHQPEMINLTKKNSWNLVTNEDILKKVHFLSKLK